MSAIWKAGLGLACTMALASITPLQAQEINDLAKMSNELGEPGLDGKALADAIQSAAGEPLGSQENPVRADGPRGEQSYLRRLRCTDGSPPSFERKGSFGKGGFGYIVDGYAVRCGDNESMVFMDMYHRHTEQAPIGVFSIVEASRVPDVAN